MSAATATGADAIHPGYGFLSENSEFAKQIQESGLVFIGPSPKTIEVMGSKTKARARVREFGVPCTPGTEGGLSDQALLNESSDVGFPVIVKAVGGGGGRGMRICRNRSELEVALPLARGESLKNFGSDDIYLERYIERPRHIEVQIFGDSHGNIVHLGTRDCSTQRRHQKIIEEAPAPNLTPELRERIHKAALDAARSVNYENAGTVEMLLSGDEFFFMEMNTRIQVEHPVTEMVTGVDLVELQLRVARGEKLPFTQSQVRFTGHAIEFRIYAEDPSNNFAPSIGKITEFKRPIAPYFREDFGYEEGDSVTPYYDAMISKMIILGKNRGQAIERSREVMRRVRVSGITTSIDYHLWLLYHGLFRKVPVDIGYVEREFSPEVSQQMRTLSLWDSRHEVSVVRDEAISCESIDIYAGESGMANEHGQNDNGETKSWEYKIGSGRGVAKHVYEYTTENNTIYTVEVTHRTDGFFLAQPVDKSGKRASERFCRMSNSLDSALKTLFEDVLEKNSPKEVFH